MSTVAKYEPVLTPDVIAAVDVAGNDSPYIVDWGRAAGVPARYLIRWRRNATRLKEPSELHLELAAVMDELDEYWLRIAEDEVRRYGFDPFEEIRIQGQCIDERSSVPLNVTYIIRPPQPMYGLRYLSAKRPKVWGKKHMDPLDRKPQLPTVNIGIITDGKTADLVHRG